QEQLATLSGLSIRTIQRIESGNRASLESLKSLAAVFETDIETLQKEIIVIDKKTEEWKAQPLYLRLNLVGIRKRSHLIFLEQAFALAGLITWLGGIFLEAALLPFAPALFFSAYIAAYTVRKGDQAKVW
ncbi:MAG: helix-turn-helix domain-containing protein, partial [Kangiella sp.]|nr:helix-turn-helix domain-containing protein [Kangiella sp.]